MNINYQIIVDMIANIGIIVFPIAIIFCLTEKITDIFLGFISGKRVRL